MIDHRVAVYFAGDSAALYQLEQWRRPFEQLAESHPVILVVRDYAVYRQVVHEYPCEVVYMRDFAALTEFFDRSDLAVVLYVNNAVRNFQALRYGRGFHVHLNHGESEKESMRSNQSAAYDLVLTAGQRGIDRYREFLLGFNPSRYLAIGRPQLDFVEALELDADPRARTVLYAPTWEATHPSMNYCSVPECGPDLVRALLADPANVVVFKPHPALGSRDSRTAQALAEIGELIQDSDRAHDLSDSPINDVFGVVDFAFFDNSSVMVDYLNTAKPATYIEVLNDQSIDLLAAAFATIPPIRAAEFANGLSAHIAADPKRLARAKVKQYYLGDHGPGESTRLFVKTIGELIDRRGDMIGRLKG